MNKYVYEKYAIEGFPNHFFTFKATEKYNEKIKKWCNQLNNAALDLTKIQNLKRFLYVRFLDVLDVIWYFHENKD